MQRRKFIIDVTKTGLVVTAAASVPLASLASQASPFEQTPLPYDYTALEPIVDAKTMEIHYSKHAAAYSTNLRDAVKAENVSAGTSLEALLGNISKYSAKMRNNGGGHFNHEMFWRCMKPGGTAGPSASLASAITRDLGSPEALKKQFSESAMTRFGSGWAWLYVDGAKKLRIGSTPNQDNPLMDIADIKGQPILGLDVWEHAYYLKYQNRRAEYVENWWKLVNWDHVSQLYGKLV
jgi:Fe-Mn family superoxide dismutase